MNMNEEDAVARCDIWLSEPDRAVLLLTAEHRPAWLQSTWAGFKPLLAGGSRKITV
ncbi:MAG: hypothetical protein ACR5LF_01085 [Symbiopectobacterium sp.]